MEIFRFIKWWWVRRSIHERGALTIPPFAILFFVSLFVFGIKALFTFILLALGGLIGTLFYKVFKGFYKEWSIYKQEKEQDAQRIINRLRGDFR